MQLFGDDVSKEIKKCEAGGKIGRGNFGLGYQNSNFLRGNYPTFQ